MRHGPARRLVGIESFGKGVGDTAGGALVHRQARGDAIITR
jgi:hypothetical protein